MRQGLTAGDLAGSLIRTRTMCDIFSANRQLQAAGAVMPVPLAAGCGGAPEPAWRPGASHTETAIDKFVAQLSRDAGVAQEGL